MKITKYLHSCLLIEHQDKIILIDPGEYTYNEKVIDFQKIQPPEYILITHEHSDHMSISFLRELIDRYPDVKIISNSSVVDLLSAENITAYTKLPSFIRTESVPHEDVVLSVPPQNTQFTLFELFTHPGDSYHFTLTAPIIALPIQAPWGSFASAIKLSEELSPKVVIPIHDWHWKEEVRKSLYQRAREYLMQSNIDFKLMETGVTIEV